MFSITTIAENLFLDVCVRGVNVVLGVVYYPPAVNYFTTFSRLKQFWYLKGRNTHIKSSWEISTQPS